MSSITFLKGTAGQLTALSGFSFGSIMFIMFHILSQIFNSKFVLILVVVVAAVGYKFINVTIRYISSIFWIGSNFLDGIINKL